jgi:sugar phosphate isomerase/epimerase
MLAQSDPSFLNFELDIYWVVKAGHDPLEFIMKHPGRFPLLHIKDMDRSGNFADVGSGTIDFESIFSLSGLAGTKHYFVEKDQTDDPINSIKNSYLALHRMLNE